MKRNGVIAVVLLSLGILGYLYYTRGAPQVARRGPGIERVKPTDTAATDTQPSGAPTDRAMAAMPTSEEDDPIGNIRLEGQVVDTEGRGVGGATVTISANPRRTATAEDDGSFFFAQLIAREYYLTAVADDQVGAQQHELTAKSPPVIIRVRQGSTLEITVVDAKSTKPIRGATVDVRGVRDLTETTNRKGKAVFRGVPSGFTVVRASAEGHAPGDVLAQIPNTPGGAVEQTIALEGGALVAGRVVDADGNPVQNARVMARDAGQLFSMANPHKDGAVTGADGTFRIPAVSGGTWRFTAHHEDHPKASSEPITLDGIAEHTGVVIEMQTGVVLAGRVVTATGEPSPWATVRVGPKNWSAWSGGWDGVRQAIAEEDGSFEFKAMRREAVIAVATAQNISSESIEVDLKARGSVDDAVLTLSVDGVISGVVVDGKGNPVAEATVSATPDFFGGSTADDWAIRGLSSATTDGDGGFSFRGLRDGTYLLRANQSASTGFDWYALTQGVRAKTGDTDVKIVLEPEGGLEGVVQFKDGSTPEVFTVGIGYTAPRPGGKKGKFAIAGLPGGKYDVVFRGPGFANKTVRDVEVKGGGVVDMGTIEVVAGRAVTGRVLGPGGAGVAGAGVLTGRQLFSDGSTLGGGFGGLMDEQMGIRREKTDATGAFRITGISRRESVIAAEHPDVGRSLFVIIPPGEDDARVDLTLVPFGTLEGKITSGGEPASGATIMAGQKGSQSPVMVTAESDGSYVIAKLPAGDYLVTAMVQSGFTAAIREARSVKVVAGVETTLDIDIGVGTITLVVEIVPEKGATIDIAQVFLAEGSWAFENVKQLNLAFIGGNEGSARFAMAMDGKKSTFEKVKPGSYSACIIPITGSLNDPRTMERLNKFPELLKVYCKPLTVKDAPQQQTYTTMVPGMETLPDDTD